MLALLAPVLLAWSPKVGDRAVYRLVETARTVGMTLRIDGTITETTTEIKDGRVIRSRDYATSGGLPGGSLHPLPARSETVVCRADGGLLDLRGNDAVEDAFRTERLEELALPKAPVVVGGTWTVELPPDPNASNTGLRLVYTLVGEERVGAWDTWKIESKGGETGDGAAKIEATFWIDKATGARIRVHARPTDMAFPGDGGRRVDAEEDLLRQP